MAKGDEIVYSEERLVEIFKNQETFKVHLQHISRDLASQTSLFKQGRLRIEEILSEVLTDASAFNDIFNNIHPDLRQEVFEWPVISRKVPSLIQTASDVALILEYLPEALRKDLFYNSLADPLQEAIASCNNASDFNAIMRHFAQAERDDLYSSCQGMLVNPNYLDTPEKIQQVFEVLSPVQRAELFQQNKNRIFSSVTDAKSFYDVMKCQEEAVREEIFAYAVQQNFFCDAAGKAAFFYYLFACLNEAQQMHVLNNEHVKAALNRGVNTMEDLGFVMSSLKYGLLNTVFQRFEDKLSVLGSVSSSPFIEVLNILPLLGLEQGKKLCVAQGHLFGEAFLKNRMQKVYGALPSEGREYYKAIVNEEAAYHFLNQLELPKGHFETVGHKAPTKKFFTDNDFSLILNAKFQQLKRLLEAERSVPISNGGSSAFFSEGAEDANTERLNKPPTLERWFLIQEHTTANPHAPLAKAVLASFSPENQAQLRAEVAAASRAQDSGPAAMDVCHP
ncbi:MAG: hypothetical protein DHS20C10_01460 [marine bacterium B5-7]|nr:MAG: hypothetical protein DHS20C10_01460 [marine bacterium B5-7]